VVTETARVLGVPPAALGRYDGDGVVAVLEGQTRRLHAAISQLAARHEFAIRTTWSGQDGGASASWWRSSAGRPDRTPCYAAGSGSVAVTSVPPPAGLWTLSLPPSALTLSAIPTSP
jgi:hypothetical protein